MLSRSAASRRQALYPDPGWVSQRVASSRSASASGAYISSRHPERRVRSARPWVARVGHRQRIVGAKAVDPRIHFGRGRVTAGSDRSPRLGKALGFPGEAALALGLGFRVRRVSTAARSGIDGVHQPNLASAAAACQSGGTGFAPAHADPTTCSRLAHELHTGVGALWTNAPVSPARSTRSVSCHETHPEGGEDRAGRAQVLHSGISTVHCRRG
jgi:hypothetical protein